MQDWTETGSLLGIEWKPSQTEAMTRWEEHRLQRMLLFFPTGEGKSKTSLALMWLRGYEEVVVIAPPRTHAAWHADAKLLDMDIRTDSHQKFRMKATQYKKTVPIIMDEFHLLGGQTGMGWKKFNRMAVHLKAPIIMASATPNYNDAERVFCLTAIGDEQPNRNYLNWLYENCVTEPNYFSTIPDVVGFKLYDSAISFLLSRKWVAYVEDTATWTSLETNVRPVIPDAFESLGFSERHHRIMASDMEKRHKRVDLQYLDDDGRPRGWVQDIVEGLQDNFPDRKKWLIFCNHKTIANALYKEFRHDTWLITGDTKEADSHWIKNTFIRAEQGLLIGTTALATGVDGIDKVCQSMLILDDIEGDPSLRRQLIGRILPRGKDDGIERVVITVKLK